MFSSCPPSSPAPSSSPKHHHEGMQRASAVASNTSSTCRKPAASPMDVDEPPKSTRAAPSPAPAVTDPQYFAYCLESAALLHKLGTLHHDRGNPTLESEGLRASRRRLGRSNVAILCNLSLTLGHLGRNRQDVLDVANAALQISTRMEEDARQYREAVEVAANNNTSPAHSSSTATKPNDEDGLDLTVLPYVRGRAHHGLADTNAAMEQYRSFLSTVERSGHRSSHPYSVAAMQQILTLSQSDALVAIEEVLRKVSDGHAAAAA